MRAHCSDRGTGRGHTDIMNTSKDELLEVIFRQESSCGEAMPDMSEGVINNLPESFCRILMGFKLLISPDCLKSLDEIS